MQNLALVFNYSTLVVDLVEHPCYLLQSVTDSAIEVDKQIVFSSLL